jgi:hypothetical protein
MNLSRLCKACLAAVALTMAGAAMCADAPTEAIANIGDISIAPEVRILMPPFYHGSEQAVGAVLGGGLGGAVAGAATSEERTRIANYVRDENIDIGAMVRSEFERQLLARPEFASRIKSDAPSRFVLSARYGLSKIGFGGYKPYLSIHVMLIDANRVEVWKRHDYIGGLNSSTPALKYDDYFSSPETFKSAFTAAAKEVVALVLKKL